MFKLVYMCQECGQILRTHEKNTLSKDVVVYMPWPCKECVGEGKYLDTGLGIPLTRIAADLGEIEYNEDTEDED